MNKQTKQQATLQRLRSLADRPEEHVRYALELLDRERSSQIVPEALSVITAAAIAEARPVLLRLYDYYDAAGVKRDAGGHLRTAILTALLPIADLADWVLAERATMTYEFLPPGRQEVASGLRVAGLVLLSNLDHALASYHCVRLLTDVYTSRMSGEPATSAVRLLAGRAQALPVYMYVLNSLPDNQESIPEVVGECLRNLTQAPSSVVDDLFARYMAYLPRIMGPTYETKDDVELAGFFDLLLAHATQSSHLAFIEESLRKTQRYELYRYLVAMIIASHQPQVWTMLLEVARRERDTQKIEILLSAFAPVRNDPVVSELVSEMESKAEK